MRLFRRQFQSPAKTSKNRYAVKWLAVAAAGLAAAVFAFGSYSALAADSIPDRLFPGRYGPMEYPPAPKPKGLVPPPGEEQYFPIRVDGQPYILNIDQTVNLTDALNRFYYDPRWRGERWTPPNLVSLVERTTRLMGTWPEYNEANQWKKLNKVNVWFERYSGFGP